LNADAGGNWDDRCLRLDTVKLFVGVDRDGPEIRAILGPEMVRIRERVAVNPESESKAALMKRFADRCGESNLTGADSSRSSA